MLRSNVHITIALALVFSLSTLACATTFWVDGTYGNDGNSGLSQEDAFATIQRGIDAATAEGDVVKVVSGTYSEAGNTNLTWSGRHITVISSDDDPSTCVIDCNSLETGFEFPRIDEIAGGVVQGFSINGTFGGAIFLNNELAVLSINNCLIEASDGDGIMLYRGGMTITDSQIQYCEENGLSATGDLAITNTVFYNNGGIGAYTTTYGEQFTSISGCQFRNNGTGLDLNVYPSGSVLVDRCYLTDNYEAGIGHEGEDATIRNCFIARNGLVGLSSAASSETACLDIFNCTITDNGEPYFAGWGIFCAGIDLHIVNSIVWGNLGSGVGKDITIDDYDGGEEWSTATIEYSDVGSWLARGNSEFAWGEGNISTDPLLVTGSPLLTGASPCIDSGDPVDPGSYYLGADINGDPRVLGPRVDIGADEYTGCFPITYSTYNDWVTMGRPACWCAPPHGSGYQCDGDGDGNTEGALKYRVFSKDLAVMESQWKKTIEEVTDPCADFDHKPEGALKYRVFSNDLARLTANWKKKDAQLPGDCPRWE